MKNFLYLLSACVLFFSCVDKAPKLNEEEYKTAQVEYEALKDKLSVDKDAFFNDNEEELIKRIALFRKLKDSTTVFEDINSDSLFYLKNVKMHSINFKMGSRAKGDKVVFLAKRNKSFSRFPLIESYKRLYSCEENKEESCRDMKTGVLNNFLDIKYAFVVDGFRVMEPAIDGKDSFVSGLFFASILVYDIENDKPLYTYVATATNSEQISYRENSTYSYLNQKPIERIKNDFNNNITKAVWEETKKHFDISSRY